MLPLLIAALSGLGGALASRKKTGTQTQTSSFSPEAKGFNDVLMNTIRQRLASPSALPSGYQTSGVKDINRAFDLVGQNTNANLTSRGLSTSPVAGAVASGNEMARAGQIGQFNANLPIVERDLRNQDLGMGQALLSMQPRTTTGTSTQPDNMLGGGIQDFASMLAFLHGSGAFGKQGSPVQPGSFPMNWSMAAHL